MKCVWFHLSVYGIPFFFCVQEESACASVLSPTATRFDADYGLELGWCNTSAYILRVMSSQLES